MWVKLSCIKHIEIGGEQHTYHPGDWVNVGRGVATEWIAEGCAWVNVSKEPAPEKPKAPRSGFTMFTIPMNWEGVRGAWQDNAIRSWLQLTPKPNIILLYDDPGTATAAQRYGCDYVPGLKRDTYNTPLISETFRTGQERSPTDIVCYCNTDIILAGLGQALMACAQEFEQFLMVGRRWDVDITKRLKLEGDWRNGLAQFAQSKGHLHNVSAIDYFGFRKGLYPEVPEFTPGRSAWDNWLVSEAIADGVPVIDATEVVLSVHQEIPSPGKKTTPQPGAKTPRQRQRWINRQYYDARRCKVSGTVKHAGWTLTSGGLKRK